MSVKKIGKARWDAESSYWRVENSRERFEANPRLIDQRKDVKESRKNYSNAAGRAIPSVRQPDQREEFFETRKALKRQLDECIAKAYAEIKEESFSRPVLMRIENDMAHGGDWRFCLYHGVIYQFDKPDYSYESMVEQIMALEGAGPVA